MQVVVDTILTSYEVLGDNKKILVILPGWRRPYKDWINVAKQLSDRYKVVLLDLPGFGNTAMPPTDFSIYDYADFVEHFLKKLEIKNFTLMGHSFGGRIGIILASKSDNIDKLILVDAAGIEKRSLYAKAKITLFKTSKIFLPKNIKNSLKNSIGSEDYKSSNELRKIFIKVINEDLTYLLPKIKSETILIWGDKDSIVPLWKGKLMRKLIPKNQLRIIWGAMHNPQLEKPDEFMEVLNEYVR